MKTMTPSHAEHELAQVAQHVDHWRHSRTTTYDTRSDSTGVSGLSDDVWDVKHDCRQDTELHSMRTTNKGGESCGNAPARVDATCQMIVTCDVTDASHDTQQAEPVAQATLSTLAQAGMERPKDESGADPTIPATLDRGSDSTAAVEALER